MTLARRSLNCATACAVALTLWIGWTAVGVAQTKRPMTLVDLLEVPNVGDPQVSNDGRQLLYVVRRVDWKSNRRIAHIYRINTDGTGPVQLTFGDAGESAPRWSPDGKRIAFAAVRPDAPGLQIYVMDNDGGEPRPASRHAGGLAVSVGVRNPLVITWAPDGKSIFFLARDARTDEEIQRDRARADLVLFDDPPKAVHLWKVQVDEGTEQRITSGDFSIVDYSVSADGRRIAIARAPSTASDDSELSEVWLIDADGKNGVQLTRNEVRERDAQLSPDGTRVLFIAAANAKFEPYYNDNVFIAPAGGGPSTAVLPDFPYEVQRAAWAPDGRTLFVLANMGLHTEIVQIDPTAHTFTALTDGKHSIQVVAPGGGWSVSVPAGVHLLQRESATEWGEVYSMPIAGGALKRLTHLHEYLDRDFKLARQERFEWKGADGATIDGLLYYPADYEAGKKYPLIVQPHGGPEDSDKYSVGGIQYFTQALTSKGYLVLKPNYRGSTGYGNPFMRDMVGGFFKNSHLDVLAGVDALVKQGLADPDRLGIMGHSAGAHLTNKIVTITTRFKAASSSAGVADWLSFYSQTDLRTRRALWFGGTPYQPNAPLASYLDQSPVKDAWKVKTPIFLWVGDLDARVPKSQSIEMLRALKANGVPAQLGIAPNEGHNWDNPRRLLGKATMEIGWFEKYVMNRPYNEERAPGDPPARKPQSQ
jgi:dipeptidyl aminopeptidase/acylaminoacyl peptidase